MLVMQRKYGQVVYVGDAMIKVERGKGRSAVLVIDAPNDVPIVRGEKMEGKARPNFASANGSKRCGDASMASES